MLFTILSSIKDRKLTPYCTSSRVFANVWKIRQLFRCKRFVMPTSSNSGCYFLQRVKIECSLQIKVEFPLHAGWIITARIICADFAVMRWFRRQLLRWFCRPNNGYPAGHFRWCAECVIAPWPQTADGIDFCGIPRTTFCSSYAQHQRCIDQEVPGHSFCIGLYSIVSFYGSSAWCCVSCTVLYCESFLLLRMSYHVFIRIRAISRTGFYMVIETYRGQICLEVLTT